MRPRWGGTTDDMLAFARWVYNIGPYAAEAQSILPTTHLEIAVWGQHLGVGFDEQLARRQVHQELVEALHWYLESTSAHAPPESLSALNAFLLAVRASTVRAATLLLKTIERIDGRATPYPWSWWANPAVEFQRVVEQRWIRARQVCALPTRPRR